MPIHDWTRVDAGIFHDFHLSWLAEIKRALNQDLLPPDYYALAEQWAGGLGPDVLTLRGPGADEPRTDVRSADGGPTGVALATRPPRVRLRAPMGDQDYYARKARRLVVRHVSAHRIVAAIEVMSPGNKSSVRAVGEFVQKAWDMLDSGVHLLIVDLFPPTARDPNGIHDLIWEGGALLADRPASQPLTCAAYQASGDREAFVESMGVGEPLPEMPLFIADDLYVPVPLDATYQSAWESVPALYRRLLADTR